jgi:2-polyprenyl-3-methyl-5-hydroxy-6-metoxy-1,4-benzoquinol methylase
MNRKARRAAAAHGKTAAGPRPVEIAEQIAEANRAYQQGSSVQAEAICKQILTSAPAYPAGLNLLGVIYQASGRHKLAIKMFSRAIASDGLDAACHYNIANSYQLSDRCQEATVHFKMALALGMGDKVVEDFVVQNPKIAECAKRAMDRSSLPVSRDLIDDRDIATIATDIFLRCALQSSPLRGVTIEFFLTHLRVALLRFADVSALNPAILVDGAIDLFCALAQQCFINEYVFTQSNSETQNVSRLRDLLLHKLAIDADISPCLLAAVGAYFPLHSLPEVKSLLGAQWPPCVTELLRQQVVEPIDEAEDRRAIATLTTIDSDISLQVKQQYEENPYPRWTTNSIGILPSDAAADPGERRLTQDILIAGCGTGKQAIIIARHSPEANILAVDISRTSLGYARRKTRELDLRNIEYAQADILNLGAIGRSFDRIETVGVLHHLADPEVGWRVLLSLLRPDGIMHVGLYSQAARRSIVEARALIVKHGYSPTTEDIRALRQIIIRDRNEERWKFLLGTADDFYSTSGCRDLFFNVMEHRTTIPEIAAFLNKHELSFLGFELDSKTIEKFRRQYSGAEALTNLNYWSAFETANPQTFRHMYMFSVCKNQMSSCETPND